MRPPLPRAALGGLLLLLVSCAPISGRVASKTAPTMVSGSAGALADPEVQKDLSTFMASPEIREGTRQLASSAAEGAVDGLASNASRAQLERLAADLGRATARGMFDEVERRFPPEQREAMATALAAGLTQGAREVSRGLLAGLQDVLAEERQSQGVAPSQTMSAQMRGILSRTHTLVLLVGIGLAVLAVILLGWFLVVRPRLRKKARQLDVGTATVPPQVLADLVARSLRDMLADPAMRARVMTGIPPEERPPPH